MGDEPGRRAPEGTEEASELTADAGEPLEPQEYIPDLSPYNGKGARARNRAIEAVIAEDFPDLQLTHTPKYNPFIRTGVAKPSTGTQFGKASFGSRAVLRDVLVHEELHHRWWSKGRERHHGRRDETGTYIPSPTEDLFYGVLARYKRMRGW